ncbi:MAG: single-stranded DNA-binding protein [bacterium]|nr:single-stranded DNA-binding protein [bacterium]
MNLNKVFIIGRLTGDVKLRTTPNGQTVASFGVATNRVWNDRNGQKQEKTDFHNIVAWGRTAEIANQYLTKGSTVLIEGRVETRSWEGADGAKKWRTDIITERLQLGPKPRGSETGSREAAEATAPKEEKLAEIQLDEEETPEEINPEEVPF